MSNSNTELTTTNPWTLVKDFVNESKTMVVRLTSRTLPPKWEGAVALTHYTWELLQMYEEKANRHFPVGCRVTDGQVSIEEFHWDEFIELLKQVYEYVRIHRQDREDQLTQRRLSHNSHNGTRGLKTLSREDAKKREVK